MEAKADRGAGKIITPPYIGVVRTG